MSASARLMLTCVRTGLVFLACSIGMYWLIVALSNKPEFAALIVGLGALPIVIGMGNGFVRHWQLRRHELTGEMDHAARVARHASVAGWVVLAASVLYLIVLQPAAWTPWAFALGWGVAGGGSVAVAFGAIRRDLLSALQNRQRLEQ